MVDDHNLVDLQSTMKQLPEVIRVKIQQAMTVMQGTMALYAQSIAHRASGDMADSIHAIGPTTDNSTMAVSVITSDAAHSIYELERGGDHDWASRTLAEQSAVLDALQNDIMNAVVKFIGV